MRHTPTSTFSDSISLGGLAAPVLTRRAIAVARVLWILGWPARMVRMRREMAMLGAMTDGQLKDIGLVRQDVWDAVSLPLGQLPDHLLTQRAAERRRAELHRRR